MILHSLTLTNFRGLLAGVGLPEVTIDFDKLPPGLIAIVGGNGMGKTTILDNCHPYRLMPYKLRKASGWSPAAFSFYDECVGEAKKELVFSVGGLRYRSLVLIDADRRKQEAYLYANTTIFDEGNWYPLNDGKTRTYDEAVEKLCGSPSLFFTSVFRAQGARNLSDYTRGDIMAVVAELLNVDHIKEQGDKARKVSAVLVSQVETLAAQRDGLTGADLEALRQSLADVQGRLAVSDAQLASFRSGIDAINESRRQMELAQAAEAVTRQRIADKRLALSRLQQDAAGGQLLAQMFELQRDLAQARAALPADEQRFLDAVGRKEAQKRVLAAVLTQEVAVRQAVAELPNFQKSVEVASAEVQKTRDEFQAVRVQIAALGNVPADIASTEKQIASLRGRIAALNGLDCKGDATGWINDGCPLLRDAVAARDELPALEARLCGLLVKKEEHSTLCAQATDLEAHGVFLAATLKTVEAELAACRILADKLPAVEAAAASLLSVEADLDRLSAEHAEAKRTLDERVQTVDGRVTLLALEIERAKAEAGAGIETVAEEIRQLEAAVGAGISGELAALEQKRAAILAAVAEAERAIRSGQAEQGKLLSQIEAAEAAAAQVGILNDRIAAINAEAAHWNLLAKACSNDGVVALEIDDSSASISSLANELLRSCYGPRFSLKFETQSAKVNGELKEDFDIVVFDSERGEQKSITALSGGETVWVEDAATRAICLHNIAASGRSYGTMFSDEKDGQLSAERKAEFMAVKRKAMALGNHTRELFISQTPDVVDMADGCIRLSPGMVSM